MNGDVFELPALKRWMLFRIELSRLLTRFKEIRKMTHSIRRSVFRIVAAPITLPAKTAMRAFITKLRGGFLGHLERVCEPIRNQMGGTSVESEVPPNIINAKSLL